MQKPIDILLADEDVMAVLEDNNATYHITASGDLKAHRSEVLDNIWDKIRDLYEPEQLNITRETGIKAIKKYYIKRQSDGIDEDDMFSTLGMNKHWSLRRVVSQIQRPVIQKWVLKHHGLQPGNPKYLGQYQSTLSSVLSNLTVKEKLKYQEMATKWNRNGPPPELKKILAKKNAAKMLTNFPKLLKTHLGMDVCILSAWVEKDAKGVDKLHTNRQETFQALDETSFLKKNKVALDPIFTSWQEMKHEQLLLDEPRSHNASKGPRRTGQKSVSIELSTNKYGYEVLQSWNKVQRWKTKDQQQALHTFFMTYYRDATGNPIGSIPWTKFCNAPSDFLEDGYFPDMNEHGGWRDPSKMKVDQMFILYNFYEKLAQEDGPLMVWKVRKEVSNPGRKGKGLIEAEDSNEDEDEDDDEDEDEDDDEDESVDESEDGKEVWANTDAGPHANSSSMEDTENVAKALEPIHEEGENMAGDPAPIPDQPALDLRPLAWKDSSESRRKFMMNHLVDDREYLDLVQMYFTTKKLTPKGKALLATTQYPEWMSWDYGDKFLPETFHTLEGFEKAMELVTSGKLWKGFIPPKLAPQGHVEQFILGVGMTLRDFNHVQFTEELGEDAPLYIGESNVLFARRQELLDACELLRSKLQDDLESMPIAGTSKIMDSGPSRHLKATSPLENPEPKDSASSMPRKIVKSRLSTATSGKRKAVSDSDEQSNPPKRRKDAATGKPSNRVQTRSVTRKDSDLPPLAAKRSFKGKKKSA